MNNIKEDDKHQFVAQDICMYCGECKSIVMQTRFTKEGRPLYEMGDKVIMSIEPCDKCKEKNRQENKVIVLEMRDGVPTERYCKIDIFTLKEKFRDEAKEKGLFLMNENDFIARFESGNQQQKEA